MNLPSERLVLALGVVVAGAAYVYWTVQGVRLGEGWSSAPSGRAAVALGGVLLLALVLRVAARVNRRGGP